MRSKAGAFRFFPLPPISGLPEIGTNNWHKSDISDFVLERVASIANKFTQSAQA